MTAWNPGDPCRVAEYDESTGEPKPGGRVLAATVDYPDEHGFVFADIPELGRMIAFRADTGRAFGSNTGWRLLPDDGSAATGAHAPSGTSAPLTCDRCRSAPAVRLVVVDQPGRSQRHLLTRCAGCGADDMRDAARLGWPAWQFGLNPVGEGATAAERSGNDGTRGSLRVRRGERLRFEGRARRTAYRRP